MQLPAGVSGRRRWRDLTQRSFARAFRSLFDGAAMGATGQWRYQNRDVTTTGTRSRPVDVMRMVNDPVDKAVASSPGRGRRTSTNRHGGVK